jgi:hypothetical protein
MEQVHPPKVINLKLKLDACFQPYTHRKIEFIEPLLSSRTISRK